MPKYIVTYVGDRDNSYDERPFAQRMKEDGPAIVEAANPVAALRAREAKEKDVVSEEIYAIVELAGDPVYLEAEVQKRSTVKGKEVTF